MGNIKIPPEARDDVNAYIIGTAWLYEIGNAAGGSTVYADINDVYEESYHDKDSPPQDGLVRVRIKYLEHIPAEECWAAKEEEAKRREQRAQLLNRDGYVPMIGGGVARADYLINLLKKHGFLSDKSV